MTKICKPIPDYRPGDSICLPDGVGTILRKINTKFWVKNHTKKKDYFYSELDLLSAHIF